MKILAEYETYYDANKYVQHLELTGEYRGYVYIMYMHSLKYQIALYNRKLKAIKYRKGVRRLDAEIKLWIYQIRRYLLYGYFATNANERLY